MDTVTPRFADIAATVAANGYAIVPLEWQQKRPCADLAEWPRYQYAPGDEVRWPQAGLGILCHNVAAIDIDVYDEELAEQIAVLVQERLGTAPRRTGRYPKCALIYRTDAPIRKLKTREYRLPTVPELAHVEILGAGQQLACFNLHEDTGKPYAWNGAGSPLTTPYADLRLVTEEQLVALRAELDELQSEHGEPVEAVKTTTTAPATPGGAPIPEGGRNAHLISLAGSMRRRGMSGEAILAALLIENAQRCTPSLAETEVKVIAASGARYEPEPAATAEPGVSIDDFYAYMPQHVFIFTGTGELWPASSVNSRIPRVIGADGEMLKTKKGEPVPASAWLDQHRPVEQMTWAPGEPKLIEGRLIAGGGWIRKSGCTCFNLYVPPPDTRRGDPAQAQPWLKHVRTVFADDAQHIIRWLAHRVQKPGEKVNHALVLGGKQGIGKDTVLEPVKYAIGPWNFTEVSPGHLLGRFNSFVKSVILRVSEARDLGDTDRYGFYEHLKTLTAAPPDVLRCDEKNIREHSVLNACGVIITTNHKDGLYLPADDRRHYVAWSGLDSTDFEAADYWPDLYRWFASGGKQHVAAYLRTLDLSTFDAKAPPPKTPAFWDIVDLNRAPEDAELADVLEEIGYPEAITLKRLVQRASGDFQEWLMDRRSRRQIPHRLEAAGYTPVRNSAALDGLWKISGKRQAVYAQVVLPLRDRLAAAQALTR